MMHRQLHRYAGAFLLALVSTAAVADAQALVERGRYLARTAGCNDCHTPRYAETAGNVPEKDWLVGDSLGWRGPWGTTYAANLRLVLPTMSEKEWVAKARTATYRPPMPWFALRDMNDEDLRALYQFVRALGPGGVPAPAYVPPGIEPKGAAVVFPMAPH